MKAKKTKKKKYSWYRPPSLRVRKTPDQLAQIADAYCRWLAVQPHFIEPSLIEMAWAEQKKVPKDTLEEIRDGAMAFIAAKMLPEAERYAKSQPLGRLISATHAPIDKPVKEPSRDLIAANQNDQPERIAA